MLDQCWEVTSWSVETSVVDPHHFVPVILAALNATRIRLLRHDADPDTDSAK